MLAQLGQEEAAVKEMRRVARWVLLCSCSAGAGLGCWELEQLQAERGCSQPAAQARVLSLHMLAGPCGGCFMATSCPVASSRIIHTVA